ncbi:hypothetical protein A3C91_01010 [Candidatus Azambacteria bacterium RIFCSPHIGHO2_02_FULL_52_12]|uniref:Amino acid aminotransferase n=1 Tax=Candidatus Azambacteria bacterium RIFCSPLOWO2_01_FULL_46_25 TaxID=1797298 RepID=A0A1F5BU13_9BACT|nr:MAG: hypothetical protein A3C91_01010 [Candidatus Azambacteria bacterium RIFCSPHIGHO2_02_FULL_52_12]OGD34100.1 MAG: hypothetical protein A2988_01290 [Candidatus Azambacteria bacterium RIFCSPLOWO2_01_FULL_46_25]OGD36699.1 MAG: hypothetical protein A2850_00245 [Candidatus Azambacteria bacterium RIFCSPHIGHO2_01_FULL_51_74]
MNYCFINGRIVSDAQASVGVHDVGFLRGYGVSDPLRTYNGKPFMLDEHIERLAFSGTMLGLKLPYPRAKIKRIVGALLAKNNPPVGGQEASIRMILTGGESKDGMGYDKRHPGFFILVSSLHALPESAYTKGLKLITREYQRELPEAKTLNYVEALLARDACKKAGALEPLYVSRGKVLEAATSNFFIVKNGALITPKQNILHGITRRAAIDCARELGMRAVERDIAVRELKTADEAFITATSKEIAPVVRINGMKIGNGRVGKTTHALMGAFRNFTAAW